MQILIRNLQKRALKPERIRKTALKALGFEGCGEDSEVSIVFTDDTEIARLNEEYRGIEGPTDVLAFSQSEGDEFAPDEEESPLGDVVISVETAQRQADEHGHALNKEIDILLVHGILHLLGHDHANPEDEKKMFSLQSMILSSIRRPRTIDH